MKKRYLRVKKLETNEEVHKVEITNPTQRKVERVMLGMLQNMNTDNYYIDDDDFNGID